MSEYLKTDIEFAEQRRDAQETHMEQRERLAWATLVYEMKREQQRAKEEERR